MLVPPGRTRSQGGNVPGTFPSGNPSTAEITFPLVFPNVRLGSVAIPRTNAETAPYLQYPIIISPVGTSITQITLKLYDVPRANYIGGDWIVYGR